MHDIVAIKRLYCFLSACGCLHSVYNVAMIKFVLFKMYTVTVRSY